MNPKGRLVDPHLDAIAKSVVDCAYKVHSTLGPGLLEQIYETCLIRELKKKDLRVSSQVPVPVIYDGEELSLGFRLDLLVSDSVVVEIKAVEYLLPVHQAQLMTYLKLSGKRLGLLINFNVSLIKNGIRRVIM